MAMCGYFINGYLWLFVVIYDYFINGYLWLLLDILSYW
jgi:hypothetical protein